MKRMTSDFAKKIYISVGIIMFIFICFILPILLMYYVLPNIKHEDDYDLCEMDLDSDEPIVS